MEESPRLSRQIRDKGQWHRQRPTRGEGAETALPWRLWQFASSSREQALLPEQARPAASTGTSSGRALGAPRWTSIAPAPARTQNSRDPGFGIGGMARWNVGGQGPGVQALRDPHDAQAGDRLGQAATGQVERAAGETCSGTAPSLGLGACGRRRASGSWHGGAPTGMRRLPLA